MSLVYITHHTENIFDIEKKDSGKRREKLKYTSKYHDMVRKEVDSRRMVHLDGHRRLLTASAKDYHQTMGPARTPLNGPCNYLRKNQGIQWQRLNEHKCPPKQAMPTVTRMSPNPKPKAEKLTTTTNESTKKKQEERSNCSDDTKLSNKVEKDFISINIDKVKSIAARKRPPRYVDTPQGDVHNLLDAGLIPQYIHSKKFSRVPYYLLERKKELARIKQSSADAKLKADIACEEYMNKLHGVHQMSSQERMDIIDGLKKNFSDLFKIYQSLSLYTDTIAKKLRKGRLENQLRQLEQDINLMELSPQIYING